MTILHILYSGLGGHGNVFFSLVHADKQKAYQYRAIFNGIEDVKEEYRNACIENNIPFEVVRKKPGLDISYFRQVYRHIADSHADVVFLHSSGYILPAIISNFFLRKKKMIIVRETQANQLKAKMDWVWLSVSLLFANRIVFLSEEYNQEIKKALPLLYRKSKVAVIPNGLDLEKYKPVVPSHQTPFLIGMQSRLVRIKDHLTLLRAMAKLRDSGLVQPGKHLLRIAGDGEFRAELESEASKLNIRELVEFTGMLPESELVGFLEGLDMYIHASLGETMSTAIMQAMACGLPIIASDVKGINNMISNEENGLLVPAKDPDAMATAIARLLNDQVLSARLRKAARTLAEQKFSNTRMLESYGQLFRKSIM